MLESENFSWIYRRGGLNLFGIKPGLVRINAQLN